MRWAVSAVSGGAGLGCGRLSHTSRQGADGRGGAVLNPKARNCIGNFEHPDEKGDQRTDDKQHRHHMKNVPEHPKRLRHAFTKKVRMFPDWSGQR